MNFYAISAFNSGNAHQMIRCAFFTATMFFLVNLTGCSSTRQLPTAEELPDGVAIAYVAPRQVKGGWEVTAGIESNGDGTPGTECGVAVPLQINPTLRANLHVVRETCNGSGLSEKESKWIEYVVKFFSRIVEETPSVNRFFRELGPVEYDWFLVPQQLRFVHTQTTFASNSSPRLALRLPLAVDDAENHVKQLNMAIGVPTVVHEYFHALALMRGWQFDTVATNETMAHLLNHTVAVELGLTYAAIPTASLKQPLDRVWEEAATTKESAYETSVAGQRLAYRMIQKALACQDPRGAIRGTARIAYDQIADQGAMTLAELKKIDALSCEARQAKGDGGVKYKCDAVTKVCTL